MKLLLATRNADKLREIRALFQVPGLSIVSALEVPDLPEVVEDRPTLEGNAGKKAVECARHAGLWALADDTGLEVHALDGAPGVYSARYAGEDATYEDNCDKLLAALDGHADRRARFRTVLALATPDGHTRTVDGECHGVILHERRGKGGFGYDPIFQPEGHASTFAELPLVLKNQISHRGRALRRACDAWADLLSAACRQGG